MHIKHETFIRAHFTPEGQTLITTIGYSLEQLEGPLTIFLLNSSMHINKHLVKFISM